MGKISPGPVCWMTLLETAFSFRLVTGDVGSNDISDEREQEVYNSEKIVESQNTVGLSNSKCGR